MSKMEDISKLENMVDEGKEQLRKLRFDNKLGRLDDTSKIKKKKKEIARNLTKLNFLKKSQKV